MSAERLLPVTLPADEDWLPLDPRLEQAHGHLRRVLQTQLDYQEVRQARITIIHALAVLGVVHWLMTRWPGFLPLGLVRIVVGLWWPCLAGTGALLVLERIFSSRRRRSLANYP